MAASTDTHQDLVSLVYVSSATREFQQPELLEVLRTARNNNQRLDITGMLLYKDGNFMQVLEGPREALSGLMSSIERDSRHRGMIVLIKKPIEERQFANWSMAFKDLNEISLADKAGYSPFLSESLLEEEFQTKPERCYKLLLHFKKNIR
ncbi:MAG TPA: BLUF domain-containing protein [Bryobacteraceae bacterium]|nr:BLUF domain-containing protein [Bryobacteraceae bacterium]